MSREDKMSFDERLPWVAHQIVGVCVGIIVCAWFTGATPEEVALIRLPATVILSIYVAAWLASVVWRVVRNDAPEE
jgi:hypothetical protein